MKTSQIQRSLGLLIVALTTILPSETPFADSRRHFELRYFGLSAPARAGWKITSERTESIWFMRLPSDREFTMIGALRVDKIDRNLWAVPDEELARIFIDDYRQSAIQGGHGFSNEQFHSLEIGGKTFFAASARITTIHKLPVDSDYDADEMVYVYIAKRKPGDQPNIYLFLYSDFRKKPAPSESNLSDFMSVLESFYPRETLPAV